MSAKTVRLLGIVCLITAALMAVLNLKRVANLGTFWLSAPLLVIGIALVAASRRKS
jgi:hypothetical protein